MGSKLSIWLNTELQTRGWSERELARRAELSHSAINNALSGEFKTRLDTYKGIARAFSMQLEDVLRAAGELPKEPPAVANEEEVIRLFRLVPDEHRELVLRVLDVFAHAPARGANPGDWSDLAPGQSVILRKWGADHPLIQVLENLKDATGEEAMTWLLGHLMQYSTSTSTTSEERKSPTVELAR